ncbi:Uu.00g055210.m01.CDS01 [Anthostomella pinea]|uniref:Uu.00g055210.m01.CDS01 n=1 Tax=Anthostomella pinea TaxID=933095 RepID=A0AAI8VR25_9PEZI|nr:Uu.00g055210.m01.CDS01 [Anthostomella pinea]
MLTYDEGKFDNAHLKSYNDTLFCCESDSNLLSAEACLNSSFHLSPTTGTVAAQLRSGIGAITVGASAATSNSPSSSSASSSNSTSASSSSNSTSASSSSNVTPGAIAGLAVEGVLLALTLAALGFFMWRNRSLGKRVKEAEAAAVAAREESYQAQQQYQQHHLYQRPRWQGDTQHVGTVPEMATYGYGSPVDSYHTKASELPSTTVGPELDGTEK